ncbi:hypothetical protein KM043_002779 [Ampulex compressa]|nr:hypothetical protein KM043_002779 [Ampulex compressa]
MGRIELAPSKRTGQRDSIFRVENSCVAVVARVTTQPCEAEGAGAPLSKGVKSMVNSRRVGPTGRAPASAGLPPCRKFGTSISTLPLSSVHPNSKSK